MNKLLSLSYKGDRAYLRGSDFFVALTEFATEVTGHSDAFVERLAFRRFASRACEVTTMQPADISKVIGQARFSLPAGMRQLDVWLIETDLVVTSRCPFDEHLLLAEASFNEVGRTSSLPARSIYTPIEDVIALTKHLNYSVSPDVEGKWIFGQLDLVEPLTDNYRQLEIQMKNMIAGRFSVNEIVIDGRIIGTIRFIVATKL